MKHIIWKFTTAVAILALHAAVLGKSSPSKVRLANKGVLQTSKIRVDVRPSPYQWRILERSTGRILLQQDQTSFRFNGDDCTVIGVDNIASTNTTWDGDLKLSNTTETAHLRFTVIADTLIRVELSSNGAAPANIQEQFLDQAEHVYGIWEYPFSGAMDNRGADRDLLGYKSAPGTHYANARAPFYMTSGRYGIYVDTLAKGHYTIAVNNKTGFDFDTNELTYYVIYGPDYSNILKTYNQLAGPSVMPPDWAYDSIWWRNDDGHDMGHQDLVENRIIDSAQDNVEATANYLRYYHIPASAIWIDRPFSSGGWGWGNPDFKPDDFPDPQGMINTLNRKGYHLLIWIANRTANQLKTEGLTQGYLFTKYSDKPAADMRNPAAYDWFKQYLNTYVRMGVQGYKIDRGHEGEMPDSVENENVYLFNRMASEGMRDVYGDDHLIFSRNAYDKSRQYLGVWDGDTRGGFEGLRVSVKTAFRCGMINFPYFGSDTGCYKGTPSRELFARWLEFSTYCTMMQVLIGPNRTIWYQEDYPTDDQPALLDIARKQCTDHHDLIPYTKSCMYQATQSGMPVIRPLIFVWSGDKHLTDVWDEFLYGPALLVGPVLTEDTVSRSVYLPEGKWLDYNDKKTAYAGPSTITSAAPLDRIPLYVRAGAIIPRGDIIKTNNNWTNNWKPYLRIECFPHIHISETFNYYTGSRVVPLTCSMTEAGNIHITFDNPGISGTLEIYCGTYTSVTRNGSPLTPGKHFSFNTDTQKLTLPFNGATQVEITGAKSIFGR